MVTTPLPELLTFSGNWPEYVETLYNIYQKQIVQGNLHFLNIPVKTQYRPPSDGKGFGFWHVISEGPEEAERVPDFRRCERIRWIAWAIENVENDPRISWWKNKRGRNTHIVLWIEEEDFAVILAERKGYYLLKTSYCIEEHRRKSMKKDRERYEREKARNG
jgi:hypothetical protein